MPGVTVHGMNQDMLLTYFVQQQLPKVTLPKFCGKPGDWVDFIVKFRDIVHKQTYLTDFQRNQLLLQHLEGEAKRSVKGYATDSRGYVLSLKRLKYLFGQRPLIAQAVLGKVTKGKAVPNDDVKGLTELYYSINDCLVTLRQLNYGSDLKSSDTLRQVIQRLPSKMHMKWAEYSLIIRRKEEPNLEHLNEWLQARVLAMKEAYLPDSTKKSKEGKFTAATTVVEKKREKPKTSCNLCKNNHLFWKCDQYTAMKPSERFQTAKRLEKCFNCLTDGHKTKDCSSKCSCLTPGCDDKHHTSLHGYFTEGGRSPKVNNEKGDSSQSKETKKADGKKVVNGRTGLSRKNVYLMIVRIKLFCKNGTTFQTYALLDDCSEAP